jgi:hypothetical protein
LAYYDLIWYIVSFAVINRLLVERALRQGEPSEARTPLAVDTPVGPVAPAAPRIGGKQKSFLRKDATTGSGVSFIRNSR